MREQFLKNNFIIVILTIVAMLLCFCGGFYTGNLKWSNNASNSLEKYDYELFEKAKSQTEMTIASNYRYENYHEYYERVVERIKNHDFNDEKVKTAVINYIDDYEKRKEVITDTMFPYLKNSHGSDEYGTLFGSAYPKALLDFDKLELSTYQMILNSEFSSLSKEEIYKIFEY